MEEQKLASVEKKGRGRPRLGIGRMVLDSYSIDPAILVLLKRAGEEVKDATGKPMGKSALIREALHYVLSKHGYLPPEQGQEHANGTDAGVAASGMEPAGDQGGNSPG